MPHPFGLPPFHVSLRRYLPVAVVLLLAALAPSSSHAQNHSRTPTVGRPGNVPPPTTTLSNALSVADLHKLAAPLTLGDFPEMQPSPALKDQLTEVTGFIENAPTDGHAATEKTTVYLGYTGSALYVAFMCFDSHPGLIRAHLARRENILSDDNVAVLLDPFQDHRRGVLFQLNPVGVQADAAWTDGSGNSADYSYDQIWNSEGRLTPKGWMALFTIPFRSVRFRPGAPGWGVVLIRNIPRNSETDTWPHVATNISGTLTQEGTLRGIEGITGSHNLQINPYALGQNTHTLNTLDPNNPFFSTRHLEGTAGGDAKAILHNTIVIDATVNPDFSQVESDQPQFTVNQRYPVYFPELRPFFLENANYFATPIRLLYTRNIIHPEFGARLTGKLDNTNLGLLVIDDRAPGEAYPQDDPDHNKHALFAVGRASQDLGRGSSVGAIYTDYEFNGSFSRVGGLDFTARLNDKWTASGQMVESASTAAATADTPETYSAGPASRLEFDRSGHSFNFTSIYRDNSTGFRTDVGFIPTLDVRSNHTYANYMWYPKNQPVQSIGVEGNVDTAFDHAGNRVYRNFAFDPFFLLARKTVFAPLVGANSDTVGPQDGYNLNENRNFAENYVGAVFKSAPIRQLNWNLVYTHGGNVNYNPAGTAAPALLHQDSVQALVSLLPFHSLTIDNTYLLDRNHAADTGADVYENQTLRTKLNYQFTRALSARVIVEYDSVLVNPAQTSLVRTKEVGTQALLTWLPHPGTAIYVGYNNDIQNLDRILCQRGPANTCDPTQPILGRSSNYLNDGRQFFIKGSYLFRF